MNREAMTQVDDSATRMAERMARRGPADAIAGAARGRRRRAAGELLAVLVAMPLLVLGGWWAVGAFGIPAEPAETPPLPPSVEPLELQLQEAVKAGDRERAAALLDIGVFVDWPSLPYAATAMLACDVEMLDLLVSYGVPRVFPDPPWEDVAMLAAVRRCDADTIESIYAPTGHIRESEAIMDLAIERDDPQVITRLATLGVELEGPGGYSSLYQAMARRDFDTFELLLVLGADPSAGGETGDLLNTARVAGDDYVAAIEAAREGRS
ncbi:hypothetical protein [Demequina pelophila]|uniref:hypothetical protein n=1 Tax=Demequina pelophila TaxID=1638984 RepID=UPI0007803C7E|nr:hypothetical protein [Demequina pelophila]